MHNLPDALIDVNNDRLPGVCEVRGLITVFANILARLAGSMMRGPPQEFLALARLNIDFAPIEEKVDHWFDLIRKNEFSERDCSLELAGYVQSNLPSARVLTYPSDPFQLRRRIGTSPVFLY
jgi:dynactin 1